MGCYEDLQLCSEILLVKWLGRTIASKYEPPPFEWVSGSRIKGSCQNPWSTIALHFPLFSRFINCSIRDGLKHLFLGVFVGGGEASVCLVYPSLSFSD